LILSYLSVRDRPRGLGDPFRGHLDPECNVVEPPEAKRGSFGVIRNDDLPTAENSVRPVLVPATS